MLKKAQELIYEFQELGSIYKKFVIFLCKKNVLYQMKKIKFTLKALDSNLGTQPSI